MKRQLLLFLTMTLLTGLALLSLSRVQFSTSLFELLPGDLVEVRGMDWLNSDFSRDGQLIVTIKGANSLETEEISVSLAEHLREQTDLVSTIHEEMPVDRLARDGGGLLAWLWLNAEPEELKKISPRFESPQSKELIDEAMYLVQEGLFDEDSMIRSYDPLALTRLPEKLRKADASEADAMASEDKLFRMFYLEGSNVDFSNYRDSAKWLEKIKSVVSEWRVALQIPDHVQIGLTGTPAFMAEVGTEMERDMTVSVFATMILISILFGVMHRQTEPLGWLIAALCLVLILTLAIGGVLFGKLSVMSAGFAAILLGLAVDYGIVLYRESIGEQLTTRQLRSKVGPAIVWAAVTTAVVFLSLNFSTLPGLAEMGNLVAIGIALGAVIMIYGYGWIAVKFASKLDRKPARVKSSSNTQPQYLRITILIAILIPVLAGVSIFVKQFPTLEAEFHPFRIRSSPSMVAWQEMQRQLKGRENSVPVVMRSDSIETLTSLLHKTEGRIKTESTTGTIDRHMLPIGIAPNPANQKANLGVLIKILTNQERVLKEIEAVGFSGEGVALTKEVLQSWQSAIDQLQAGQAYAKPHGKFATWSVGRLFREGDGYFAALGSVRPASNADREWINRVCDDQVAVASLSTLGAALNDRIGDDLKRVFLPMIGFLVLMLAIVFRSWKDWLLAMFCLIFSTCVMIVLTLWTPLSWNSFNICGLPLLFGVGLDFGIHMIFALRRGKGDIAQARQGIGKALLFCGSSSAIGFGSLALASAHGLASLGVVCAVGIFVNMLVVVFLLPYWYRLLHSVKP